MSSLHSRRMTPLLPGLLGGREWITEGMCNIVTAELMNWSLSLSRYPLNHPPLSSSPPSTGVKRRKPDVPMFVKQPSFLSRKHHIIKAIWLCLETQLSHSCSNLFHLLKLISFIVFMHCFAFKYKEILVVQLSWWRRLLFLWWKFIFKGWYCECVFQTMQKLLD